MVELSDSFRSSMAELARELRAGVVSWRPDEEPTPPAGASVLLLLAGGAEGAAIDLLAELPPGPPVYLVGAAPDHRLAAAAVQRGARDYFALPEDLDVLRRSLEREAREAQGRAEAERFAEAERTAVGFEAILGRSAALRQTLEQAARVASHRDVTVLIGGETGTGKELLARAIHYGGPRAPHPFVEINCAAIPATLLESELFGHERGAFTGAVAAKPGLFELAHGGTLFLDEIGALPLELQPKLLRALESRTIRRVGGQQGRQVDVRVIGATHLDLAAAAARGRVPRGPVLPAERRGADAAAAARAGRRRRAPGRDLPGADCGGLRAARTAALARPSRGAQGLRLARETSVSYGTRSSARSCSRLAARSGPRS